MSEDTNSVQSQTNGTPLESNATPYKDLLAMFPQDLVFYLFSFLDVQSLCKCACVNNAWKFLACNDRS
jgi:hypothetical protein